MAKGGPTLLDRRLMKAVSHPTRVDILNLLFEGPSSPSKIAKRLENVSVNLVSHHIKVLLDLDCVELVEEIKHGGRTERVYRAKKRHWFSDEEWSEADPTEAYPITVDVLRLISEDVERSLASGGFDRLRDGHLSRIPLDVDREGWREVGAILERALEELLEVGRRSAERGRSSEEELMKIRVVIMQFLFGQEG